MPCYPCDIPVCCPSPAHQVPIEVAQVAFGAVQAAESQIQMPSSIGQRHAVSVAIGFSLHAYGVRELLAEGIAKVLVLMHSQGWRLSVGATMTLVSACLIEGGPGVELALGLLRDLQEV